MHTTTTGEHAVMVRTIIGWRKSGAPIYLIQGAEDGSNGGAGQAGGGAGAGQAGPAGAGAGTAGPGAGGGGADGGAAASAPGAGAAGGQAGSGGAGGASGQQQQTPAPVATRLDPGAVAQLQALGWTAPQRSTEPGETAGFGTGLPSYGHREALQEIVSLRAELGRDRVGAKTEAAKQVHQAYAQALGVEAKPEAITAKLSGLMDADTRASQAELRLAVYQRAATIGANADRLLDSQAFLAKLTGLDPAGVDALDAKIREAANADPVYRTQAYQAEPPKAGQAVAPFGGTTGQPNGKPKTLTSALDALYSK